MATDLQHTQGKVSFIDNSGTEDKPTLYIIAGCNGAGKTTASMSVLPEVLNCREFVNADEIAKGLSPFNPEEVAIEAGKLMLRRINLLLSRHATFAIETTLATKSYKNLVKTAQASGYQVVLLFFWAFIAGNGGRARHAACAVGRTQYPEGCYL